ncbi:hypothetical protein K431DRAFT_311915 [Polychaeton citri CBS 116435]|uniref:Uncharacterized protein n=1 Tax=Polychaeton citri CBS 116435 TaxID=1314669 RepID=A0A9P4UPV6_9PEZI|nr:hypothetical protein K431DRAFT_311915 [Polychaeton citri CBS 116435]
MSDFSVVRYVSSFMAGHADGNLIIEIQLISLLASLILSVRIRNGHPAFVVSGACLSLTSAVYLLRSSNTVAELLALGTFTQMLIVMIIMASMVFVSVKGNPLATRLHAAAVAVVLLSLGEALMLGVFSAQTPELAKWPLTITGFVTLHLICTLNLWSEAKASQSSTTHSTESTIAKV